MTPCSVVEVHELLGGGAFQQMVTFALTALRITKSTDLFVSS
jgi:hypothetical protein